MVGTFLMALQSLGREPQEYFKPFLCNFPNSEEKILLVLFVVIFKENVDFFMTNYTIDSRESFVHHLTFGHFLTPKQKALI